jgi:hypothetical protein
MTVSPCLDMATLSIGADLCMVPLPSYTYCIVKAAEILYLWVVVVAAENHNKMSEMASLKVVIAPC